MRPSLAGLDKPLVGDYIILNSPYGAKGDEFYHRRQAAAGGLSVFVSSVQWPIWIQFQSPTLHSSTLILLYPGLGKLQEHAVPPP